MPLDALIELTHEGGGEILEADAVDVSSGGLSLRASFMPPVGARMQCRFGCPPHGDRVVADCEVVWSVLEGPHAGAFGVRFLALDTRSATLIRRLLEPDNPHVREVPAPGVPQAGAEPPRVASLHIDGLGAPIEADVQVDERDHVLLTQELSFLRLGRGVRVEIEGLEERRGRIASVKLEHVRSDTPALALGVLIDAPEATPASGATVAAPMPAAAAVDAAVDEALEEEPARGPTDTWPQAPLFEAPAPEVPAAAPTAPPPAPVQADSHGDVSAPEPSPTRERAALGAPVAAPAAPQPRVEPDEVEQPEPSEAPSLSLLDSLSALGRRGPLTRLPELRVRALAWLASVRGQMAERTPEWRSAVAELWARLRAWLGSQAKRVEHFKRAQKKRRTTAPAPRGSNVEGRRVTKAAPARARRSGRGRLVLAGLFAFAGVAGAIYSLAPRRSHDALALHREVQPEQAPVAQPVQPEPAPATAANEGEPEAARDEDVARTDAPASDEDGMSFGAADVPNGRTYSLRMSGPIERIEGEELRGGFAIRVPGRLSLDRAAPIATSHPALSRSLILNQGDRAELTIEFAPGKEPAYRVQAQGNNLEITVERL